MASLSTPPRCIWDHAGNICNGLAVVCSLGIALSVEQTSIRAAAIFAALGSGTSWILVPRREQTKPFLPVTLTQALPMGEAVLSRQYSFQWDVSGGEIEPTFTGEATVFRLGDRLLVKQIDNGGTGTYVMDLKRQENNRITGVWWYYGGTIPHGTYIGSITADESEIKGLWRAPQGQNTSGNWILNVLEEKDPAP